MHHPLDFIPQKNRKPIFITLLSWTLLMLVLFQPLNIPLMNAASPLGIISLQNAWTEGRAQTILQSWDSQARLYAAFGLGFDSLFMPSYAVTLALGTLLAASRNPAAGKWRKWFPLLGAFLGWGAFAAGLFDGFENVGLWFNLLHPVSAAWTLVASLCACCKFTLLAAGIIYGLTGWLLPKGE